MKSWRVLGLWAVLVLPTGLCAEPAPGQEFHFSPGQPRHVTAMIEFRDPSGKLWPQYFVGKPSSDGRMVFDASAPVFTGSIQCDVIPQSGGSQDRRILGSLFTSGNGDGRMVPPAVSLTYQSMTKVRHPAKEKEKDKENPRRARADVAAVLHVAGREIPLQGEVLMRFEGKGKDGPVSEVHLMTEARLRAEDLGLKNADGPVEVRVFTMAYAPGEKPLKK